MQIKAKILDENNEPIAGANVVVLNANGTPTNVGDASDFDGLFVINNSIIGLQTLIRISYLGYTTITIPVVSLVATKNIVKMQPDSNVFNPVEVIGIRPNTNKGFNWWWLLALIPIGYGAYKLTENKPKKVTI